MLSEIAIRNVAVIEEATAVFSEGFTVLTGETGAGKSILIDSVNAILGSRTSKDIVRSGADKSSIWAEFSSLSAAFAAQVAEAGYPAEDSLLIQREISAEGKNSFRINGMPATATIVRELCSELVNIHGQHDNQNLLNPAKHLGILDAFGGHSALLAEYQAAYAALRELQQQAAALSLDEAEKNRKMDLLRYEVEEIEAARLQAEEEDVLVNRRDLIRNAQRVMDALATAYACLTGGDEDTGAATLLSRAAGEISGISDLMEELAPCAETLSDAYYTVTELASDIQSRLANFEFGEDTLDGVETRLDLIYRLKQKYGASVAEVLEYGAHARKTLEGLVASDEKLAELARQEAVASQKAKALADALTQARLDAFERLNSEISEALAFLNMPGIVLALQAAQVGFGPSGQDSMEFLISTNPGETPKPLAKIASGGELARIMLAIKSALAGRDAVPTVIYDEIDTGISGLAAGRVGQMMRDTAKGGRQVICVTHTAQIAAYASRHLMIEKKVEDGRTYTSIRALEPDERVDELARIISGDRITDLARANAREMLRMAQEP